MKTLFSMMMLALLITKSYSQVFASAREMIHKNTVSERREMNNNSEKEYNKLMNQAVLMDSLDNHSAAIAMYSKAIELNKDLPEAFDKRGISHSMLQHYNQAIKDFDKAISLSPKNAVFYNHRAITYYCLAIFDLALEDYDYSILLKPDYGKAFFNRGLLKIKMENKEEAINDLKDAIKFHYPAAQVVLSDILN
jgi:tetratricopeptide (TPR) repeat protein